MQKLEVLCISNLLLFFAFTVLIGFSEARAEVTGQIRSDFSKRIEVVPGVTVNAVTTWYYVNCVSVGVGSYSTTVAPKHGDLAFADDSLPIPGCNTGPQPATIAFYTWTDTSSLSTTDDFQLIYSVNGLSETIDVHVDLTKLKILFDGKVVTGTEEVAIGEQINLSLNIPPPQSNQWIITGDPIGGRTPTVNFCSQTVAPQNCVGGVLPMPSLTQPTVTFYWVKPGTFEVNVGVKRTDGTMLSANASFNVIAPSAFSLTGSSPGVTQLLPSGSPTRLSCGDPPGSPCLRYDASVTTSFKDRLEFVQILNLYTDDIEMQGGQHYSCSSGNGLDNNYPFLPEISEPGGGYTWDAPDLPLATPALQGTPISHDVTFWATMYLLWKAERPNSIFVPLASSEWKWHAKTVMKKGAWSIESASVVPSPYVPTDELTWQVITSNGDPDQCTSTSN
ncbi:MAG: hypothetical protein WBS24_17715 [Terriglobales bacterium]